MNSLLKKQISVFLIALIGFSSFGNSYFLDTKGYQSQDENLEISSSEFLPSFDQGLEFSPVKINVPGFKALDTVFDLFSVTSDFFLDISHNCSLKADWLENVQCFFCVHSLLFPFHYFW
jgi:hypothetical protein